MGPLLHYGFLLYWIMSSADLAVVTPVLKDGSLVFSSQLLLHLSAPFYNKSPPKSCLDRLSPCPLLPLSLDFTPLGLSLPSTSPTVLFKVTNDLHVAIPSGQLSVLLRGI